jgi:hypothetical protein
MQGSIQYEERKNLERADFTLKPCLTGNCLTTKLSDYDMVAAYLRSTRNRRRFTQPLLRSPSKVVPVEEVYNVLRIIRTPITLPDQDTLIWYGLP